MTISFEHHVPIETPPSDEVRQAMISIISTAINDLAGLSWKRYEQYGRGLVVIPIQALDEAAKRSKELVPEVFEFPYHTEEYFRQQGFSGPTFEQIKFFLDKYDPEREVVFLVLRNGSHSYFVIAPDPPPPKAEAFVGRFN